MRAKLAGSEPGGVCSIIRSFLSWTRDSQNSQMYNLQYDIGGHASDLPPAMIASDASCNAEFLL